MEQKAVLEAIVKALDSKRAEDIQVICVKNLTILGDYFVIANGTSTTHTKTLADEVECSGFLIEYMDNNIIIIQYNQV